MRCSGAPAEANDKTAQHNNTQRYNCSRVSGRLSRTPDMAQDANWKQRDELNSQGRAFSESDRAMHSSNPSPPCMPILNGLHPQQIESRLQRSATTQTNLTQNEFNHSERCLSVLLRSRRGKYFRGPESNAWQLHSHAPSAPMAGKAARDTTFFSQAVTF
jgi:hypothetical protein